MKKYHLAISLIICLIFFISTASKTKINLTTTEVVKNYRSNLDELISALKELKTSLDAPNPDPVSCQKLHLKARIAYKKTSFLFDYQDPEFVTDNINGAPLPKLERNYSQVNEIEPKGLQILEELIYEDNYDTNTITKARALAYDLLFQTTEYRKFFDNRKIEDYQIIEAIRYGLVRFATLGLSGFDQPASNKQIEELCATWLSMQQASTAFTNQAEISHKDLSARISKNWDKGFKFLKKQEDFNELHRAFFIKDILNPLFADLLTLHKALDLPLSKNVFKGKFAFNYEATSVFDNKMLNPFFYTNLVEEAHTSNTIELGKMLFFDPVLSVNNQRACASCHNPQKGFTDGLTKGNALDFNGTLSRNTPTVLNAVYSPRFFLDLRAMQLENLFAHVFVNDLEFNTSVLEIIQKLNYSDEYVSLFAEAYPSLQNNPINQYTINSSLASYITSLRSFNSPFDKYMRNETAKIEPEVIEGFNIFMGKGLCATCHFAPSFGGIVPPYYNDQESEVLGVPAQAIAPFSLDKDLGRAGGLSKENHPIYHNSFKTVGLRNVALTAPYMHNGVYNTLEEVIDFYNNGGGAGMGLDVPNQTLPSDSLHLSYKEKFALKAFLESLTDTTGLTNKPTRLPEINHKSALNARKIGGNY